MSSSHAARPLTCVVFISTFLPVDFRAKDRLLPVTYCYQVNRAQNFANTYLKFSTEENYQPLYIVSSSRVATLADLCLKTLV